MQNKKTVQVVYLIAETNRMLKLDTLSQSEKKALCMFLETVLHDSGNYKGYMYQFAWPQIDTPNYAENLKLARSIEFNRIYLVRSNLLKNEKVA